MIELEKFELVDIRKEGQITHNKYKHIPNGEEQQRPDLRVR